MLERKRLLDVIACIALAALALAMRMPALEAAGELKSDEAFEYTLARRIAREGSRPVVGLPTTDGPRVPAHRLYVFAAPLVVADGPIAVMRWVALLNSAAVVAAFALGRRDLGRRTALAWALLLATAPALVRYSRTIWGPDLLVPFSVPLVLALARWKRKPAAALAALPIGICAAHVHYAAVGLVPLGVAAAFVAARRASRVATYAAVAVTIAIAAPFAVHELTSGFPEVRAAVLVASGKGGRALEDRERESSSRLLIIARTFERLSPTEAVDGLDAESVRIAWMRAGGKFPARFAEGLLAATCVVGFLLGCRDSLKKTSSPARLALVALIAAWSPFLAIGLPARPHYALVAAPPLALAAASAIASLRARKLATIVLAVIAAASIGATLATRATIIERGGASGAGFDVVYGAKIDACRFVVRGELALRVAPRPEYGILLDEALRELEREDPAAGARFHRIPYPDPRMSYWLDDCPLPVPRAPRGIADFNIIVWGGGAKFDGEAARFGPIAVIVRMR